MQMVVNPKPAWETRLALQTGNWQQTAAILLVKCSFQYTLHSLNFSQNGYNDYVNHQYKDYKEYIECISKYI